MQSTAMKLAETTTIPKLAKASGINPRTLFRRLMALHARHGGDWLVRGKRNIRIDVGALHAMHGGVLGQDEKEQAMDHARALEKLKELQTESGANGQLIKQLNARLDTVEAKLPKSPKVVYFLIGDEVGAIKIGFTGNLRNRMASLQTGVPFKLRLVGTIPGTVRLERSLHKVFEEYRLEGEWFAPKGKLHEFLVSLFGIGFSRGAA